MRFALAICVFLTATTLAGCFVTSMPIGDDASKKRVLIQKDYVGFEQIQELNDYTDYLLGLPAEAFGNEIATAKTRFADDASTVNRLKYVLALYYNGPNQENDSEALSLLGDSNTYGDEAGAYWRFFIVNYRAMFEERLALMEANKRVLDERQQILVENEQLKKSLKDTQANLAKTERQLSELTSIEQRILEREIAEDTAKP